MRNRVFAIRGLRLPMLFILLAAFALQAGCATPVGVGRLDPREADRRLTASVLSGDAVSSPTLQILNRAGLTETVQSDPAAAIAVLHRGMPTASRSDRLFALAELSFLHAARSRDRAYYLAAAVYAYAFLFPPDPAGAPDPFDPRLRTAVDLYNRGLAGGFTEPESRHVVFDQKAYRLPFGELAVRIEPEEFRWGPFRLIDFIDAAEIDVRGLRNDYRWPGIGTALVAGLKHVPGERQREFSMVPSSLKVAATAFLQLEITEDWLSHGRPDARIEARLSLFTTHEGTSVNVGGRTLPLEFKSTSALASALDGSQVYSLELRGLLSGDLALIKKSPRFKDNVFLMAPYRPGRIPLVLVHGTASSPARWAEMLNEIVNDPELWSRYQIWLFTYNTGNPILYSGGILAQGLRNVVRELDPEGRDEALRKMVIIGHSQGGMLAKLTVVASGDRFWRQTFKVPPEQLDVSPEARDLLRRSFFFEPLPFVRRVVFIATPHRGSFLVGGWVTELLGRVITLPFKLLSPFQELFQRSPEALTTRTMKNGVPRSIDNMDPGSPFVRAFTALPVAEGVSAHSIIAVDNPEDPEEEWDDGVVAYRSARFDGAASELIVHSGHSVQQAPQTIEEVRRILIENLRQP